MKHKILFTLLLLFGFALQGQVEGITYQAVLVDNNPGEIPGVDVPANSVPERDITVRFSILEATGDITFQEIQPTRTDAYGTISLTIGQGEQTAESIVVFELINWDGPKTLQVDIDIQGGQNFIPFSSQPLTYVPYVRHRNLIADGVTNLNNDFYVNNESQALLSGDLIVQQDTRVQTFTAFEESNFNGRVTIEAPMATSNQSDIDAYPLRITGSDHGMAIELNDRNPERTTNFVSFWDGNGTPVGRIEGFQALTDVSQNFILEVLFSNEPDVDEAKEQEDDDTAPPAPAPDAFDIYLNNDYGFNLLIEYIDLLEASATFGWNLGACIGGLAVLGDCDDAAWSFLSLIVQGVQLSLYIDYHDTNVGVAFESGGADYAEWLRKADPKESLTFGEVVGVRAGEISTRFTEADRFMVISRNPIVSGAMPSSGQEHLFKQVAFIGQVPVKVLGTVNKGDFILPSGNGDGLAIAVPAGALRLNDYKRIIGVAWEEYNGPEMVSYINTAVGLNTNELALELSKMQLLLNRMQDHMSTLDPNFEPEYFDINAISVSGDNTSAASRTPSQQMMQQYGLDKGNTADKLKQMQAIMQAEDQATPNFSFAQIPFLEEVLANPTPENIQKYTERNEKALEKLKGMMARARN
ncbi:hypothetical protein SAMN04490243_1923 [Robiginitalea myxolifaciens]|uniref:Uncharacterized protein n=1 Tax=Robiginitalea myxolifaciens TaxID=400055 RepID=A0A1I6GYV5_9FLAO|nr:hypothetical protein [Robiginitalea myxolifaciens]SFR47422.1 hypothetical protein SAMN04490243_1923 [Robiginitalea myxolifaciens]